MTGPDLGNMREFCTLTLVANLRTLLESRWLGSTERD
jgi:hypothetical protein